MKQKKDIRIVLTGGHAATTALSIIEELVRREGKSFIWDICWIGAQVAVEGTSTKTLESEIFSKLGIKIFTINAGRLQRKFTLWTIPAVIKLPMGFIQSLFLLLRIRPDIILSFGGFAALPVVVVGYFLKIPIVIHDQTGGVGRANKLSLPFAKKIAVARESALKYVPASKSVVTGNPVMTQITEISPKTKIGNPVTIYITGGSRGSVNLNKIVKVALKSLLQNYYIIHQAGAVDYASCSKLKQKLSKKLALRYELYKNIDPMQVDGIYKRCDIIVSRAGANTVSEILIVKRPALLIPLPISAEYDQPANAKFAEDFGIAKTIVQDQLTPEKLVAEIRELEKNWDFIVDSVRMRKNIDIYASSKVVDLLESTISNKHDTP
jgi:UDP-N-acetylglucosamine--N-acetylmuramyl-(pentapeptide) pyrophosphoryl-undecaprenol N-acetylglucosamine transferase